MGSIKARAKTTEPIEKNHRKSEQKNPKPRYDLGIPPRRRDVLRVGYTR
jgi:hypothetical protein